MKRLKEEFIPTYVADNWTDAQCKAWELDENLIRAELTAQERVGHSVERVQIKAKELRAEVAQNASLKTDAPQPKRLRLSRRSLKKRARAKPQLRTNSAARRRSPMTYRKELRGLLLRTAALNLMRSPAWSRMNNAKPVQLK